MEKQVSAAALAANRMLRMIRRLFVNYEDDINLKFYKTLCYTTSKVFNSIMVTTHDERRMKD